MDKELVKQIAEAVGLQLSTHSTMIIIVQAVVVIVAAAVGAFFGEFLRTKGKHLATKADFESLKEQLQANTKLVETVKADVGRQDWSVREWTTLRRLKLEELLKLRGDCHEYLDRYQAVAFRAEGFTDRDPIQDFEVTATLYFPELEVEARDFIDRCHQLTIAASDLWSEMARAGAKTDKPDTFRMEAASKKYNSRLKDLYPLLVESGKNLTAEARKLLTYIMRVA
jgi:hypothetical protein